MIPSFASSPIVERVQEWPIGPRPVPLPGSSDAPLVAPPHAPASAVAGEPSLSVPSKAPAWLQLLPSLFAIGAGVGGAPHVGTGALQGAQTAELFAEEQRQRQIAEAQRQQQLDLQRAALEERQAQERRLREAEERRLEQARLQFVMDAKKQAAAFKTREEFDQFVTFAEAMGAQRLGLRPGSIRGSLTYTPQPVRERASAFLDRMRDVWKTEKRNAADLEGVAFDFDVDLDGSAERKTYREVQEIAGEAAFMPDGRAYAPAPTRTLTFGDAFPQARGTVLADKPMPVTDAGEPDYSKGLIDLQRALGLSRPEQQQTRADAQREARADFEAAVLAGEPVEMLKGRFGSQFKRLGLNVTTEYARIRERLFGVGARVVPESDRELDNLGPEDLISRGRDVLTGGAPAVAPPSQPYRPTGGLGRRPSRPGDPVVVANPALRAAARQVLQAELVRRGAGPRAVTDAQIDTFLSDPNNVRLLEHGPQ